MTSSAKELPDKVFGVLTARLTNYYSPAQEANLIRHHLGTGIYLDKELCKVLEDDRRRNITSHITVDRALKNYLLQLSQHQHTMTG